MILIGITVAVAVTLLILIFWILSLKDEVAGLSAAVRQEKKTADNQYDRANQAVEKLQRLENTRPKRLFIVAGNYREAMIHAQMRGLERPEWEYVNGLHKIRGYQGGQYTTVGTFRDRDDWPEIQRTLAISLFTRVYWDEG
jgi:hypothetical protein